MNERPDRKKKKESSSIVARKSGTFLTTSTHDDGTTKRMTERIASTGEETGCNNLRFLILDDLTCLCLSL